MTLQSMTGFARYEGQIDDVSWVWEFRSVNGKGLDVRLRLPPGFETLEAPVRKICQSKLSRGNIQANLSVKRGEGIYLPSLNEPVYRAIMDAMAQIEAKTDTRPSSAAEILSIKGVLDTSDADPEEEDTVRIHKAIMAGLETALAALIDHRLAEGRALHDVLSKQLAEISRLTAIVEKDPSRNIDVIRDRLAEQVSLLIDANDELNRDRVHQEAALLATKADIREELDRLCAHVISAKELLAQGSPIGRKLEFLAQEFNRETNTLCSKSNSVSVTESGLALKVIIDQFREQILNVE